MAEKKYVLTESQLKTLISIIREDVINENYNSFFAETSDEEELDTRTPDMFVKKQAKNAESDPEKRSKAKNQAMDDMKEEGGDWSELIEEGEIPMYDNFEDWGAEDPGEGINNDTDEEQEEVYKAMRGEYYKGKNKGKVNPKEVAMGEIEDDQKDDDNEDNDPEYDSEEDEEDEKSPWIDGQLDCIDDYNEDGAFEGKTFYYDTDYADNPTDKITLKDSDGNEYEFSVDKEKMQDFISHDEKEVIKMKFNGNEVVFGKSENNE